MSAEITQKPLTLDTLHAGAQVAIAPADDRNDYEGAIVLSVTERAIITTAGKFTRRGRAWGSSDSWHYRSIAHNDGLRRLMTWEEAKTLNAERRTYRERKALARLTWDKFERKYDDLTLDQLQRIAAILDEGKAQEAAS